LLGIQENFKSNYNFSMLAASLRLFESNSNARGRATDALPAKGRAD